MRQNISTFVVGVWQMGRRRCRLHCARRCCPIYIRLNVKRTTVCIKQCLTATRPTSHNQNSKNQKGAITFAARRHNVNVLLSNTTFLIFAVLVV